MEIKISHNLIKAYNSNGKNPNYSLSFILNSMDPNTCIEGLKLIDAIQIAGDVTTIEIDKKNAKTIEAIWGSVDETIITKLLWVALLFPEI